MVINCGTFAFLNQSTLRGKKPLTSDAVEDRQGGKRHNGRREQDPDVGLVQSEVDERMRLKDALWFNQTSAL